MKQNKIKSKNNKWKNIEIILIRNKVNISLNNALIENFLSTLKII